MESLITEYTVVPIKWDRAYQTEIEAIYNIYDEQRNKILDLTCQDSGVTLGNYLEDLIRSTNVFVVIDKDNNICGVFSLGDMWKYKGQVITCKVHAIIPKQFWGEQSREIMKYFKDYAILNFNIRKFIATVPQCGYGIIKLLKDLGFQHEGTMKENLVYLDKNNNPKLYDELVYGLIIK